MSLHHVAFYCPITRLKDASFPSSKTQHSVRNHKLELAFSSYGISLLVTFVRKWCTNGQFRRRKWNVKKISDMWCVYFFENKKVVFQLFSASQQIISQANHPKGLISKFLHIIYVYMVHLAPI